MIHHIINMTSIKVYSMKLNSFTKFRNSYKLTLTILKRHTILIILIDRLKRGKGTIGEHVGAYGEVFTGMRLHTLHGRASCYTVLMSRCAKDPLLADLVRRHLRRRTQGAIDETEAAFWCYMANQPTRGALESLAASETSPTAPERENVSHAAVFETLLKSYGSRRTVES